VVTDSCLLLKDLGIDLSKLSLNARCKLRKSLVYRGDGGSYRQNFSIDYSQLLELAIHSAFVRKRILQNTFKVGIDTLLHVFHGVRIPDSLVNDVNQV